MRGIVAAPGMALAPAYIVTQPEVCTEKRTITDVAEEMERLTSTASACYSQIEGIMDALDGSVDSQTVEILDFQLLLLEDTDFIGKIENAVSAQEVNAEYAIQSVSEEYIAMLNDITDNDYLRGRVADVSDLSQRLINELSGVGNKTAEPEGPYIAVGRDIAPSKVAELDKSKLKGIVLEEGGITSHCVILARSLGIPCLIEATGILLELAPDDLLLLDAVSGEALIDPDAGRTQAYREYIAGKEKEKASLIKYISLKSESLDGIEMKVFANVATSAEAADVVGQGGEGVGLFRSELLYMSQQWRAPTEEAQYAEYSAAAKALEGRPLIIRTLDVGGDKQISYIDIGREDNPFLGYRAIRYCLDHHEIFMPQIAAMLRAGNDGDVQMMFPMITCKKEILEARQIVARARADLDAKGVAFDHDMKIGMMVETPAAAADAGILAKSVDFFSIGTNDLSQYLFAADRANAKLTALNTPFQPTLLRVINVISTAAREEGIEVDICGQAAEVDELIPVWLAMGITNLSVSIPRITAVRRRIRSLRKSECELLLDNVLRLETVEEVRQELREFSERS